MLVDPYRQVMIVPGYSPANSSLDSEVVTLRSGWLALGWRRLEGLLPHGELDHVDAELTDVAQLREPKRTFVLASTIACYPKGSPLIPRCS